MRASNRSVGIRFTVGVPVLLLLLAGAGAGADASPVPTGPAARRVLVLHSFGEHFEPFATASATFRTELSLRSLTPIAYYEISLETARFSEGEVDKPLAVYLKVLEENAPTDLVVPVGSPALQFCKRHREELFPGVPMVVCGVEERLYGEVDLTPGTTGVTFTADDPGTMEDILRLLPDTRQVAVVFGGTPLETYWVEESRRAWTGLEDRVEFVWLNRIPFSDVLDRVAALPPRSVVLFGLMDVDAAGVPYEQNAALTDLRERSRAPIFGFFEPELGKGIVGGRLVDVRGIGTEAAKLAVRVLGGEPAGSIPPTQVALTPPLFDERELRRWNIPQNRLPEGSRTRFVRPSSWAEYRWRILSLVGVAALEAVLIGMLLHSRQRLRSAQARLREHKGAVDDLRRELRHADRVSLLGHVTASLAHELGQPLGAILRNSEAAELFLDRADPDLEEVRAILQDVHRDGARAASVIDRLRALLEKRSVASQPLAWNEVVDETLGIVQGDARLRRVSLATDRPFALPPVQGDRVQLQQVLLNLVANAMDAIDEGRNGDRRILVGAHSTGDGFVECAVRDTGAGIPSEQLSRVFDPYVTTKPHGMGMGLPISRTIVEANGGRMWAENNPGGGATFRFTVPVAGS